MSKTSVFFIGASIALMFPVLHAQTVADAKPAAADQAETAPAKSASVAPVMAGPAPADDAVAAQLVKLQTEVMLLKAQTAKAQAQAELEKASAGEIDGGSGKSSQSGKRGGSAVGSSTGLPAVTSIYGRDKALVATLRLNSGGVLEARVGDTIPDGYRLTRIDAGKVTFTRGGRQFIAGLSAPAALPPVAGGGPLMLAPPLPGRD